jgi:hypothetical protein
MPCSIDDGRHMAHNRVTCLKTTQCFCSQIGWLGMQDASNKWTESMLIPEPIARSVLHTNGQMLLTVSHHKWLKTQSCIEELDQLLHTSSPPPQAQTWANKWLPNHVLHTFVWTLPYLKGLHFPIDGWQSNLKSLLPLSSSHLRGHFTRDTPLQETQWHHFLPKECPMVLLNHSSWYQCCRYQNEGSGDQWPIKRRFHGGYHDS